MSTMEKFANNMLTIVIARAAMIVTPALLTFFIWLAGQVWAALDARISDLERKQSQNATIFQDHESRMTFGRQQREALTIDTKEQFMAINQTLKEITSQMGAVNGSIIRMQTTLDNRLPGRTATESMQ